MAKENLHVTAYPPCASYHRRALDLVLKELPSTEN